MNGDSPMDDTGVAPGAAASVALLMLLVPPDAQWLHCLHLHHLQWLDFFDSLQNPPHASYT